MTAGTQQQAMNFESHRLCTIKRQSKSYGIGTWSILRFDIEHDANEPVALITKYIRL